MSVQKVCGIYCILNTANGKRYVGQSINIQTRKTIHFWKLNLGRHENEHLQRSFTKYGGESFEFRVLEETSEDMLDVRECAWIQHYQTLDEGFGYNLDSGGRLTHTRSAETRRKIGDGHRGKSVSEETRAKLRASHLGKPMPESMRAKLLASNLGRPMSETTRAKLRISRLGKKATDAARQKMSVARLAYVARRRAAVVAAPVTAPAGVKPIALA